MVNPFKEVNWRPGLREFRKFALSLLLGFPCLALVLYVIPGLFGEARGVELPLTLAAVGAGAGVLFYLFPQVAKPFYLAWYFVACCMGFLIGNLLLAAIYFLMVTPLGLAMRAMRRGAFRRSFDRSASTYWEESKMPTDPKRYYRQF